MPARVMRSPVRREWCISGRLYKRLFMHFPLMIRDIRKTRDTYIQFIYVGIVDILFIS